MSATTAAAFMRCLLLPTFAWAWGIVCTYEPAIHRARAVAVPGDRRPRRRPAARRNTIRCRADPHTTQSRVHRGGRRRGTAWWLRERAGAGGAGVDRCAAKP